MPAASSSRSRHPVLRSGVAMVAVVVAAAGLAGCVDQLPDAHVARGNIRNAIARGQMTSPKAATVALVSLEGAPAPVEAAFRQTLSTESAAREIALTDAASARYLVRGYLSAYPGESGGVEVAYTYDVFEAGERRRQQRVADTIDVPGDGNDPWAAMTPTVLTSLAGRSADDLAVGLAGTPEAQALTAGAVTATAASPPAAN